MASKSKLSFSKPVSELLSPQSPWIPWVCLTVLVIANLLLSYFTLSLIPKIWVLFLGLIVPFSCLFWISPAPRNFVRRESFSPPARWFWGTLAVLAVFVRFYRLTTLSPWPVADEGLFGYFATMQGEHWDWRPLHEFRTTPLVYAWGQHFFFRWFGQSLTTLWFFPALCSLACVPVIAWACRKVFSLSMTAVVTICLAFGFWPIYMGRFSTQCVLLVFWECVTFLALAWYLSADPKKGAGLQLAVLGFITGLGFYTYLAWPFVALVIGLTLLLRPGRPFKRRFQQAALLTGVVFLTLIPLILNFIGQYHGYFQHLWAFGSSHDLMDRLELPRAYWVDFFWGVTHAFFHFGPVWGGFLNPVLTSFFFFGVIQLIRSYREPASAWMLGAFAVFFLPAILTNNFETMRLSPMLPALMLLCAVGIQAFLFRFPAPKRMAFFCLIVVSSMAFDGYHLFYRYPLDWKKNWGYYDGHRSLEYSRSYDLLKETTDQKGLGLIFLNSQPDPYDQTLFTATYGFNAAENPRLDPADARWAAVLSNVHEQPYLAQAFPQGRWTWLSEGLNRHDGGFLLDIIPITDQNRARLAQWTRADQSLKDLTRLIVELGVDPDQTLFTEVLQKAYPAFQGDRLLESRYWRLVALHHCAEGKFDEAIVCEQKAIDRGYPMAHLYNEMGCLLFKQNRREEAKKAFQKAIQLKPNCTDAQVSLKNLQTMNR